MAKKKVETNIFEFYFQLKINFKSACENSEDLELKRVGKDFISEFEKYVKNANWTKNDIVKDIIKLSLQGLTANQIKSKLSLTESSYRVHIFRITENVYKNVFDGKSCPEGIFYFSELKDVSACTTKIRMLANPYNPYSELPIEIIKMIEKRISPVLECDVPRREDISDADYFSALNFIALLSNQVTKARLESLNPAVLKYVFDDLNINESGESSTYLDIMSEPMSTLRFGVNQALIQQLKNKYSSVKGGI